MISEIANKLIITQLPVILKKGKEEIIYLLNKAIEKFERDTGKEIVQNTNRKNYESLSKTLSDQQPIAGYSQSIWT